MVLSSRVTRRSFATALAGALPFALQKRSEAASLARPQEKPFLTVAGKISTLNSANAAVFDRPMLEALGTVSFSTSTPWYQGPQVFEGVLMTALMTAVGAEGSVVNAIALNDYEIEIPISDFARYGTILALKRGGKYLPVSDKGPFFIIYPYDEFPDLKQQKYFSRAAWQVSRLIIA